MTANGKDKGVPFRRGSGNVFADIGLRNPEEALAKAQLAEAISETIGRRRLTQQEAAEILQVDQPKVSKIVNGRLDGFTQDRLIRYLRLLGDDVSITVRIREVSDRHGDLTVTVA